MLIPLTYPFLVFKSPQAKLATGKSQPRAHLLTAWLALVFIVYSTSLAGIGLGMSGEMVRILTAFKLVKPIGFVFMGLLLGSWTDPMELIGITSRAYGAIVGLTMFFTLADPSFPLGEWGKYIAEFELCGYPNSAMTFYAVMVPLLLSCADSTKTPLVRIGVVALAGCSSLMILGSMSRSSALALVSAVMIYLIATGRTALLVGAGIALFVMSLIGFGLFSALRETEAVSVLMDRVQMRMERTTESEDPSSGRFEIWQLAIELWTERPVFGYLFESFSRYADYDTPHQQYLEVLHKCGGVGLLLYLWLLMSCLSSAKRVLKETVRGSGPWYQVHAMRAMLWGVMISNLTQPNLTYSLTGNMVFLLFGCLCSARAVSSAAQTEELQTKTLPPVNAAVQRRVA